MAFTPDAPTSGFVPDAPTPTPPPQVDPVQQANNDAAHERLPGVGDLVDMIRGAPSHIIPALKGMLNQQVNPYGTILDMAHTVRTALQNPGATISSIGSTLRNATGANEGASALGSALAGGLVTKGIGGLAGGIDAAGTAAASDASNIGLRTAGPIAGHAADAGPVLDLQNNAVAKRAMGNEAGVPVEQEVNHATLTSAAAAPGNVLDQGAASLPAAPLSPAARNAVVAARGEGRITKGSPIVENYINDAESRLLDPEAQFTGEQVRAERNGMNADANTNMLSQDADVRAKGKYQRAVVDALDQHIADTMPANSPISPDMIANARATLAKNYTLRDLIGKGGDIDLQALAADHRENPNKFTGAFSTVAQFAHEHPEVTGSISDATRLAPPGLMTDLANVNPIKPIGSLAQVLFGAGTRRALRGPAGEAMGAAESVPVAGLGGEFENTAGEAPGAAIPTEGISAEALRPEKLGDTLPGQRGGAPTDIGGLRQLMNNPRTYGGGAAVPKTAAELERDKVLKKLMEQPTTYSGTPLGQSFRQ